jgi:hypothetical protein
MAWKIVNTLFGPELMNTAPKCVEIGCDNYADNAGNGKYHKLCSYHHKSKYNMNGYAHKNYRKDYCENVDGRYGFVCTSTIVAPRWQLEVDHIDGDRTNNDENNLQTLCSCCHRYKTMLFEENLPVDKRKTKLEKNLKK